MSLGRLPTQSLAPEDDWFVEAGTKHSATDEPGLRETGQSAEGPGDRDPPRLFHPIRTREHEGRRRLVVSAVAVAVFVFLGGAAAGILASRSVTGAAETTTSLLTTTATLTTTLTTSTTPSTTPTTTTTETPTTLPEGVVLRRGDKGTEVTKLQAALVALGYSTSIDGKFGPETQQAVQAFQKSSGITDDGVVGPATLSALAAGLNGT